MEAEELLRRYATGERNFAGVDLSNPELTGADLSGINLSNSDLSCTELSGANLTNERLFTPTFTFLVASFGN